MPNEKRTRVRKQDGWIFEGDEIGYADAERKVRRPDGWIFKGDEIGYVDQNDKIRKPDGLIFKGDQIAQVKRGDRAHANDGLIFAGEEWGYVDDHGNIRQRDGIIFRGRIIGHMRGSDKAAALAFYVLRFQKMVEQFAKFSAEVNDAPDAARFLGRVRKWRKDLETVDALGDFDSFNERIEALERTVLNAQARNRGAKLELCNEAADVARSTHWKEGKQRIDRLRESWKKVGTAGHDQDEELWERFNRNCSQFFERRTEWMTGNRRRKEDLCHRAEDLSRSTRWSETAEALKALGAEWKGTGTAGREKDEELWQRFREACDRFYDARRRAFEERQHSEKRNLEAKRDLCREASRLADAVGRDADLRSISEKAKELRHRWKGIGHVPRDEADGIWNEFNAACDDVFSALTRERERRQEQFRDKIESIIAKKRELLHAQEEQIETLQQHIARWEGTIDNLRDGRGADEIRDSMQSKISSAEEKIESKRRFMSELEDQIDDLRAKLRD
jgi:polyhydroxyalkanoate synthesis regulator phasin/DNA polymerase III psi subunit